MMTVQEIEAKKLSYENIVASAPAVHAALVPFSTEFDAFCVTYSDARKALKDTDWDKLIADAFVEANKEAIAAIGVAIAEAIQSAVDGLEVEKLLGQPVHALTFFRGTSKVTQKDANGADVIVTTLDKGIVRFNPTTHVKESGGTKKSSDSAGGEKKGHTVITGPDGATYSLTKFVVLHATDAEKTEHEREVGSTPGKVTPHTRVDSKPKFEKFCASHNLVGYTYGA